MATVTTKSGSCGGADYRRFEVELAEKCEAGRGFYDLESLVF
jgi:hypothetical protein